MKRGKKGRMSTQISKVWKEKPSNQTMKRERFEIMAQILTFCVQARSKTRIMYKSNLSYALLKNYITLLTVRNLLKHIPRGYVTTEKGQRFIEAYAYLKDVLEDRANNAFSVTIQESYEELEIIETRGKA